MNRTTKIVLLVLAYSAAVLGLSACMTPTGVAARDVLVDLYNSGAITQEQFQRLVEALNPSTWVRDVVLLGTQLLSMGGAVQITNVMRNRARTARGEPVAVPPKKVFQDPLAPDGLHDGSPTT